MTERHSNHVRKVLNSNLEIKILDISLEKFQNMGKFDVLIPEYQNQNQL